MGRGGVPGIGRPPALGPGPRSQPTPDEPGPALAPDPAKLLDGWTLPYEGAGPHNPLFDNQLPEGRALNRTVTVTLEYEKTDWQVTELLAALEKTSAPLVISSPNADTSNRTAARLLERFVQTRPNARLIKNLGMRDYWSFMGLSAAMVGNSSSGIIEAASFKLPVVNLGTRQAGRVRSANVIDVGYGRDEILQRRHKSRRLSGSPR